jgi:hypothetical protein
LGAIKASLVLFGIPAMVAFFITPVVGSWLELSHGGEMVAFVTILLLGAVGVLAILVLWSRSVANKPGD